MTLLSRMSREPLTANVDADLLKQATINVIQNGAQSMPNGGNLEVILEEDRDFISPESAHSSADGAGAKYAVLRVRDQGAGIPEDIRGKIFDLYFTTKSTGSGIGLAMTYRIVQLHQGSVDVQSVVGRGSEFQLRFPLVAMDRGRRQSRPAGIETAKGTVG